MRHSPPVSRVRAPRVCATFAATALLSAQAPPPLPADAVAPTVVSIDLDRSQRMTVPVTVNGAGPYRFLVDTGAQATVVTPRVTDALGLVPSGRATLVAMASRTKVDTIALNGLEFAGRRFNNLVTPLLRDRDIGADGIIGLDSLQDLRVVIDFRADAISVVDAPSGIRGGSSGYEIVVRARRKLGQMIITDARIEGVRTAVIIDTGSWHSIGNRALQRRLGAKHSETMNSTDVAGGTLTSDLGMLEKLQIGSVGLADLPVGFSDSPAFAALGLADRPALILGVGNLRPFDRVAIDFATRRVLFDVPKGARGHGFDALFSAPRPAV